MGEILNIQTMENRHLKIYHRIFKFWFRTLVEEHQREMY